MDISTIIILSNSDFESSPIPFGWTSSDYSDTSNPSEFDNCYDSDSSIFSESNHSVNSVLVCTSGSSVIFPIAPSMSAPYHVTSSVVDVQNHESVESKLSIHIISIGNHV